MTNTNENSIEFIVPGKRVPYVRVTQKSKWVNKQYQRYKQDSRVVQTYFLAARSKLRLKSLEKSGPTSTTSEKESSMPLTELPIKTTANASQAMSDYTRIKITYLDPDLRGKRLTKNPKYRNKKLN